MRGDQPLHSLRTPTPAVAARAILLFLLSLSQLAARLAAEDPGAPLERPSSSETAPAVSLQASAATVGRFVLLEFTIGWEGDSSDGEPASPYDPDHPDVTIEIEEPGGGLVSLPAFWYQPYERLRLGGGDRIRDWIYPVGSPGWRARFAPAEVGTHVAKARVRESSRERVSAPVRFECEPSQRKGFVRVSRKDPRFLELSTGEPFFPVGQNVAFIGDGQHVRLWRAEEIFRKLAANGANYLRIWTCCEDWALAIEARKSAWGRSWSGEPPIVPSPDDPSRRVVELSRTGRSAIEVAPVHPVAVRPSTRYRIEGRVRREGDVAVQLDIEPGIRAAVVSPGAEQGAAAGWTRFERALTTGPEQRWLGAVRLRLDGDGRAWVDGLSLRESGGGPELLTDCDANRPIPGTYDPLDSFILDRVVEAAEESGIRLQLCLITRDLYMPHLAREESPEYRRATEAAKRLLRYAVARWGYSTSVATWEYFNEMDPGRPTGRFYDELGEFLERVDPYRHLRATSAWAPSPRDWAHPRLDVADLHYYVRPGDERRHRDEVDALLDRARFLRESALSKPALLSEFGLATPEWRLRPEMREDRELVHVHNALWASALSGLSGTALFWWWEELDRMEVYPRYGAVADFVRRVPFGVVRLEPITATATPERLRVVGLQAADRAYAWLLDPGAAWIGAGRRGVAPQEVKEAALEIRGLGEGRYRVTWRDTRETRIVGEEDVAVRGGEALRVVAPAFLRDIAVELRQRS